MINELIEGYIHPVLGWKYEPLRETRRNLNRRLRNEKRRIPRRKRGRGEDI